MVAKENDDEEGCQGQDAFAKYSWANSDVGEITDGPSAGGSVPRARAEPRG